jgi:predicted transposase YbfD/YdcC
MELIVICVCDYFGGEGTNRNGTLGKGKEDYLRRFLRLPNGIPSRDSYRRILIALRPEAFQECFLKWLTACVETDTDSAPRLIAIDGKTCRGSHDHFKGLGPLHIVSAWASEQGITLGQIATDEKPNEITAIPKLLEQIDLQNSIVTIDAMGCQKKIVEQIDKGKGAYVVAVKDNQPTLLAEIESMVMTKPEGVNEDLESQVISLSEQGHGRIYEKSVGIIKLPKDSPVKKSWPSVKAIGYAIRISQDVKGNGSFENRYFIINRYLPVSTLASVVCNDWSIEALNWSLDVTFREDSQKTSERKLVNNLSWLRRFDIGMLSGGQKRRSIVGRMETAAYNMDILQQVP